MNNEACDISILLPTYNAEKYISDSLESITQQTYKDFNILIIDDCSTDNTFNIIKRYKERDSRIQIFRNSKNLGVVQTRNKLFDLSKSEYLAICDADDIYARNRLQVQLDFLKVNKDIDAVSSYFIHGIGSSLICKFPLETNLIYSYLYLKNVFPNPGAMVRKSSIQRANIKYREKFQFASDFDFWSRLSENGKLANVDECLFSYRIHNQQISEKKKLEQKNSHLQIVSNKLRKIGIKCSDSTLRSLIWKQNIHDINQLNSICTETNTLIEKLKNTSNYLIPYIFDLSLKSVCKDYGLDGLRCYLNNRGLKNFSKSKIFGLKFAYDCFKKFLQKEIH